MVSAERTPVIDAWAQPPLPGFFDRLPEVESLLRRSGSGGLLEKGMQPPEMIKAMDEAGIESVCCAPGAGRKAGYSRTMSWPKLCTAIPAAFLA